MSSEVYTYKEILLGLRSEFVKANQQLDILREYIYVADKGFHDYYFDLVQLPYKNQLPELRLVKKEENIGKVTTFFRRIHGNDANCAIMVKNNNGEYFPLRRLNHSDRDFLVMIKPEKIVEFRELVDYILNSDFAKKMNFDNIYLSSLDRGIPRIVPGMYQYSLITDNLEFKYVGRDDVLNFSSVKKFGEKAKGLTKEYFDYIMGIEFSKFLFDEYHRGLIENSEDVSREFSLSSLYQSEASSSFEFQDRMYKLVLTKKEK